MTILITLMITGFLQAVKLIMRMFGISKQAAASIVYALLFVLVVLFTAGQQFPAISEKIMFFASVVTGSFGTYEVFLKRIGLDKLSKNLLEIKD